MKEIYPYVAIFLRWAVVSILSFIVAIPTLVSLTTTM